MTCSHWLPFYANMSFVCNYKWWYGIEGQLYHKMNLMAFMSYQNEELWWISKIVKFVQKQLKKISVQYDGIPCGGQYHFQLNLLTLLENV